MLSGQQLQTRHQSEHLGVVLDSRLTATCHVDQRVKKARATFYGFTPTVMLLKSICPADKAYLWRSVVSPALLFGCNPAPLRSPGEEPVQELQAAYIKTASGLPPPVSIFQNDWGANPQNRGLFCLTQCRIQGGGERTLLPIAISVDLFLGTTECP